MTEKVFSSYAKINLGLLLLGKRDDGFHEIATVFQQINLHDELTFRKTPQSTCITSNLSLLPTDSTNLVWKAFSCFKEKTGVKGGLEIHIEKKIPMGAGLGGGSSNAAVTLKAANQLWENPLSRDELIEISTGLGSDIPFFMLGGCALGLGRGEQLTPLSLPGEWWVVLVYPGLHIATAWAYKNAKIGLTKEEKFTNFRSIFDKLDPHALSKQLNNELEGVVFRRHPALRELKATMKGRGAFYAGMSGSGSTIYGLFQDLALAEEAWAFFSKYEEYDSYLCRPISKNFHHR